MKIGKIRELDAIEASAQLGETEEQLFRLRLQLRMGQSEGLKKYRELRKNRARLLTVQREREMAQSKGSS